MSVFVFTHLSMCRCSGAYCDISGSKLRKCNAISSLLLCSLLNSEPFLFTAVFCMRSHTRHTHIGEAKINSKTTTHFTDIHIVKFCSIKLQNFSDAPRIAKWLSFSFSTATLLTFLSAWRPLCHFPFAFTPLAAALFVASCLSVFEIATIRILLLFGPEQNRKDTVPCHSQWLNHCFCYKISSSVFISQRNQKVYNIQTH